MVFKVFSAIFCFIAFGVFMAIALDSSVEPKFRVLGFGLGMLAFALGLKPDR
jgi:hypothetical protein